MRDNGPQRAWYPPGDDGFRQWVMDRRDWDRCVDRAERLHPFIKQGDSAFFHRMIPLLEEPEPKQQNNETRKEQ